METTTTVNPDTLNEHEVETPGEFDPRVALDFDNVTHLRKIQEHLYSEAYETANKNDGPILADFYAKKAVEDNVEDYLMVNGLKPGAPGYAEYKSGLMGVSIVNFDNTNWKVSFDRNENGELVQSGRERVMELYENLSGEPYYTVRTPDVDVPVDEDEDESETQTKTEAKQEAKEQPAAQEAPKSTVDTDTSDEADEPDSTDTSESKDNEPFLKKFKAEQLAKSELAKLRTEVAQLSAKRQGKLFGKGGEEYSEALAKYNEQVIALGKLTNKEIIEDDSKTELEKNKAIIEYLFAEQNILRDESLEAVKNTKIHRGIQAFAKLMDAKTVKGKIMLSLAVGGAITAGAGLVAVGVGVAGVGVAAAAAAGATAGVTARFAKAFAQREARVGRGIQQLDADAKDTVLDMKESGSDSNHDDMLDLITFNNFPKKSLTEIEEERAAAEAAEAAKPKEALTIDQLQNNFSTLFEKDIKAEQKKRRNSTVNAMGIVAAGMVVGGTAASLLGDAVDALAPPEIPNVDVDPDVDPEVDPENETPDSGAEDAPDNDGGESAPAAPEFVPDPNFNVPEGQGGIWLFQNMGLTEADWYSVDQDLIHNFPNEFYNEGGDVRIAHPGQLSEGAQNFIKARFNMP